MTDQDFDFAAAPVVTAGMVRCQTSVYIVMATEGEFENRDEWVAGVYMHRKDAESAASAAVAQASKLRAIWQAWDEQTQRLRLLGKPLADAGPEPSSEWPAYDVIEVPVGQAGRWEAFGL